MTIPLYQRTSPPPFAPPPIPDFVQKVIKEYVLFLPYFPFRGFTLFPESGNIYHTVPLEGRSMAKSGPIRFHPEELAWKLVE